MIPRRQFVLAAFVVSLSVTARAQADPIGAAACNDLALVADGGAVSVYFAGSDAGYSSELFLAGADIEGSLFPNHSTPIGASSDFGLFDRGTPLMFGLHVLTTGERFLTGPGSRNVDGIVHAEISAWQPSRRIPISGLLIAFEDLRGGGDRDFNDFRLVVRGAHLGRAAVTPEPASLLLLGTGLIWMGGRLRRRRRPVGEL